MLRLSAVSQGREGEELVEMASESSLSLCLSQANLSLSLPSGVALLRLPANNAALCEGGRAEVFVEGMGRGLYESE